MTTNPTDSTRTDLSSETTDEPTHSPMPEHTDVLIVGSGFAGLSAAIYLTQAGYEDVTVIEQAGEVGGTWRDNTYPGCACDVPSNMYSFSFAPSAEWSRSFPSQPEIRDYLNNVAADYGVLRRIYVNCELLGASWDEEAQLWRIRTSRGSLTARVLVAATGTLSTPSLPDIPGLDSFEGRIFHSSRWDHALDLRGRHVAVIGTGASAVQFVPEIQPEVEKLTVFQRTPGWLLPRADREISRLEHWLFRTFPATQRLVRHAIYLWRESWAVGLTKDQRFILPFELTARAQLRRQVKDPDLREKLTPNYTLGCKRTLLSNDFYPALTRPNVDLVAEGVAEVRPHSVVGADSTEVEADTLICGTGFQATDLPIARLVRGKEGSYLDEVWNGNPRAYLGTNVCGFPNLFLMYGPNTNLGHNSIVYMIESQSRYLVEAMRSMEARGAASMEVRPAVQRAFNEELDPELAGTVWNTGGCSSWYLDRTGRNSTMWPTFTWRFKERTSRLDLDAYTMRGVAGGPSSSERAATAVESVG